MRKLITVFFTLVLTCALTGTTTVFAASNTYDLPELGLQVTIPTDYSVITRDTSSSASIFSDLGTTKSALITQFESKNIYLNAVSDTYNEEIVVTMMKNSLSNFNLLSETVLNTLASTLVNQYTNYGINVSKYEIYQHAQAKFVRLYFTDTEKTVHGLQYYTIYDGKAMNFTMRSYEGNLSYRQETAIKTIVDSIKYDKMPPVADQGENTNSFIHTDKDSGVTFTVPANWKQEAFTKDREFIDVKFVSTKEDGCTIIYGSTDIWEKMPDSDRVGYSRLEFNNSAFTKSDIAEMYNMTPNKISIVTYNGVQYFKCETDYTSNTYGVDITAAMTQLVYIDNGWMYTFQFGGMSTHKLYSDFEDLLNSVQYPTVSNVDGIGSTNDTKAKISNDTDDSSIVIAVVILLVIMANIVVVIVVSRKNNTSTESYIDYIQINDTPSQESTRKTESTIFCKNCGQSLPLDSAFCHVCGTKINKEEN